MSKAEAYRQVIEETKSLCEGQRNWVWYVDHDPESITV